MYLVIIIVASFMYYMIPDNKIYNVYCELKDEPVFKSEYGVTFYVTKIIYQDKKKPITYDMINIFDNTNISCHYTLWYPNELELGHKEYNPWEKLNLCLFFCFVFLSFIVYWDNYNK